MDAKNVPRAREQIKKEHEIRIKDESKIRRHNRGNGICRIWKQNIIMIPKTKKFCVDLWEWVDGEDNPELFEDIKEDLLRIIYRYRDNTISTSIE